MEPENHSHPDANTPASGSPAGAPLPTPGAGAPASSVPTPAAGDIKNDIAKILQNVKLPERREGGLSQDKKRVIEVKSFDTVLGGDVRADIAQKKSAAETVPPVIPAAPVNPKDPEDDGSVKALHTFKQDLQHVVRDNKISVVRAASLEQQKMRPGPIESNFAPQKHRSYAGVIVTAIVLLVLGVAAIFGVLYVMGQSASPVSVQTSNSLVFAEQTLSYPVDGKSANSIRTELALARNGGSSSLGSIKQIVPTIQTGSLDAQGKPVVRPITLAEFFTAIGANPPADLLRALGSDFFFGIHTVDKNAPVLVIPVTSYDRAFAGMLSWEAHMNADLSPIFTAVPMTTVDAAGLPATRTFVDDVTHNYDVRELKDNSGAVELYYSFPTRGILVIAESPYTFTEILSRLQAGKRL
ncbi:MAG: protein of unknown function with transrane region [Candidatus Kaiserbacteria bacterium]|nr:protein of unknown function with transrane region [Candidatus Kaiserbacteria bacterium]